MPPEPVPQLSFKLAEGIGASRRPAASSPEHSLRWSVIWFGLAAALAAAAISLLITAAINSDPLVWVLWARELVGPGRFDTWNGPAWHPFPMIVLVPLALITRGQADVYGWLLVSRFGSGMMVVVVAAVAYRFEGAWAALLAAGLSIASVWWLGYGIEGAAEPLMAALLGAAILADDAGWDRTAGVLCVLAALIRPESWPFIGAYALYLVFWRRTVRWWLAALAVITVLVCWAIPDLLHAGQGVLSAAKSVPNASVPELAADPFTAVLAVARHELTTPVAVLAGLGLIGVALRLSMALWSRLRSGRWTPAGGRVAGGAIAQIDARECVLTLFGAGWILIVALMAQLQLATGNPRYLLPAAAALTVEAAVVAIRLARLPFAGRVGGRSRATGAAGRRRSWPAAAGAAAAAMVVVVLGLSLTQSHAAMRASVEVVREHVSWNREIKHDIAMLRCPGWYWASLGHAAWLAIDSGQSLQQSQESGSLDGLRRVGLVRCAPVPPPPIR